MITNTNLIEAFARNVSVIKMQTDGLTHEDSLLQPPFRGNCLNWVLGHITENRDHILEALGESPVIDEFGKRYTRGSEPLTQAGDDVVRLEELLDWLERSQVRLAAALEKMNDAAWASERSVGSSNRKMTVSQRVFFFVLSRNVSRGADGIVPANGGQRRQGHLEKCG